ncbi:hypothetical protein [Helicobacter sp. T3_23-1059]
MEFLQTLKNFIGSPEMWAFLFGYALGINSKIAKILIKRIKKKSWEKKWIKQRQKLILKNIKNQNDLENLSAEELTNFIAECEMMDKKLGDSIPKNPLC